MSAPDAASAVRQDTTMMTNVTAHCPAIVVFADLDFPRVGGDPDFGSPAADFSEAERVLKCFGHRGAPEVWLLADGFPWSRDRDLLAAAYERGWRVIYISSTRSERFDPYDVALRMATEALPEPRTLYRVRAAGWNGESDGS